MASTNQHCCPKCDKILPPNQYEYRGDQPKASYLLDGDRLVIPIVKYSPAFCCGKWWNAPFYETGGEYLEAIRDILLFYAPSSDWIKGFIEAGEIKIGREVVYFSPKISDIESEDGCNDD